MNEETETEPKRVECREERRIRGLGYRLVHDGQTQPNYPVQGGIFAPGEKRFFTRTYRKEINGKLVEWIFKYDRRSGSSFLLDVIVRKRNGGEKLRQRLIQGGY